MAEMQTETQTQTDTTTAPAPVTGATSTDGKPVENQTQTEVAEKPNADSKEFARKAFKEREEKRVLKQAETQRIADLERKAKEYDAMVAKQNETKTPPSFLEDPEAWAKDVTERAQKSAIEALQRREAEYSYRQSAEKAASWLLTRSHLRDDKTLVDATAKILEEKYSDVAAINPAAAARLAYQDVCASKGVSPDMEGFKSGGMDATHGKASGGVRPAAPSGGKRVFNRAEAEKYVFDSKPGSKDYADRLAEVEEARREGRIR